MQVSRKRIVAALLVLSFAVVRVVNAQQDPVEPEDNSDGLYKVQKPLEPSQRANAITISGKVLKEDGQPARWSQVWLAGSTRLADGRMGAVQVAFVRADKEGKFEFWHPRWRDQNPQPDEHSVLWVFARTRDRVLTPYSLLNLTVEYRNKYEIHGLELTATAKADYRGRVVDVDGTPIPNARISPISLVLSRNRDNPMTTTPLMAEFTTQFSVVSDSQGQFTLIGLPESTSITAKIAAPKFGEREVRWSTTDVPELRLEVGGTIRGKIENLPADDFCEQVELRIASAGVEPGNPRNQPRFTFNTRLPLQPDGRFEIADVPPGNYHLRIWAKRPESAIPHEFQNLLNCQSKSGEITDDVQLLLPDVITCRGRVVDAQSGEPVAGAAVMFLKQEQVRSLQCTVTTDAKGEYRAYLRPGKIVIAPGKAPNEYLPPLDDRQSPVIEYTKDFEGPTFRYLRAMTFRGTVVDEEGQPVPGAEIRSIQPGRSGQGLPQIMTSDESGRFEIPQVDPQDKLPLRVRSPQGVSTAVVLASNELTEPKPIVVSPKNGFRVHGTITTQRGKPIANATVAVIWHRSYFSEKSRMSGLSSEIEKLQTNEQGEFGSSAFWETDGYHVVIEADDFSKTDLPHVKGEVGRTYDYGQVKLKGTSLSVFGKVVDLDGKPIPRVRVFNSGDAADIVSTETEDNGQFRLQGLQDGPVYVFAEHSKYRLAGTYASDPSQEILLTLIPLTSLPAQRPAVHLAALEAVRQQQAASLAEWIAEKKLDFRPNLRDSNFNALAKIDPDEALKQIEQQSKAMDQRSAILIARSLAPRLPREKTPDEIEAKSIKTALRFVERAASRISDIKVPDRQIYLNADTGLMFFRLGDAARGKVLVEEAAKGLSESQNQMENLAANVAQGFAWYDIPRALSYRDLVKQDADKVMIRNRVIVEVAKYDVPRALEMLKDPRLKSANAFFDDTLKLDLAYWIGGVQPQIASDLVATIENSRIKAEAAGWAAVSVARVNPVLASKLIDQGIECLHANQKSQTFYYQYVPGVAANLAVQAEQVNYPDMESLIQRVLSLRIPAHKGNSTVSRYQSTVNAALYLAFVDPAVARRLLADLEPELTVKMLGNGGSESVGMQQWLSAWAIADPEHAVMLLKAEMEKPRGDEKPPYWITAAYTLLALPKSEQLEYVQKYGNAGVTRPVGDQ